MTDNLNTATYSVLDLPKVIMKSEEHIKKKNLSLP